MVAVDERRSAVIAGVGLGALTTLIIGLGGLQAAEWLVFIGGAWLAAVFRRRRVGAEGQEILLDYPIDPVCTPESRVTLGPCADSGREERRRSQSECTRRVSPELWTGVVHFAVRLACETNAKETDMLATQASTFALTPSGPFSWEAACDVVSHFSPVGRHWAGSGDPLRLAFPLDGSFLPVAVALRWDGGRLVGEIAGTGDVAAVSRQVARIFSLDHDGTGFPELGRRDPALGRIIAAFPGLRPVSFTSPYECAAWAILSSRISMRQAASIQNRLVLTHGTRIEVHGGEAWAFPEPERLSRLTELAGLSQVKVDRLRAVAAAALDGLLDADRLRALGPVEGPASVRAIPGIGPFWSSGIYLRGCGIADEFTDEPLSVAALGALHGLGDRPDPETLTRLTDSYRPYRMWVTFLLRVAANRGAIPGLSGRETEIRRASHGRAR